MVVGILVPSIFKTAFWVSEKSKYLTVALGLMSRLVIPSANRKGDDPASSIVGYDSSSSDLDALMKVLLTVPMMVCVNTIAKTSSIVSEQIPPVTDWYSGSSR